MNSWKITESEGVDLVLALYVRDSCALPVSRVSVPALQPRVAPILVPSNDRRVGLGAWWAGWWESLIDNYLATAGPTTGSVFDQEFALFTAEFGVTMEEARRWRSAYRDASLSDGDRERFHARHQIVNTTLDAVAASRGRPIAPFRLETVVIPVEGLWSQEVSAELLLVSQQLRNDPEQFGALLKAIVLKVG